MPPKPYSNGLRAPLPDDLHSSVPTCEALAPLQSPKRLRRVVRCTVFFGSGAVLPLLVGVLQGLGSVGSTSISELKTLAVYGIVNPEPQTLNPQPNHPLKTHSI